MKEKDLENAFPVIFPLTFLYVSPFCLSQSRPDHQAKFLSFLRMLKNWSTLHETVKNHLLIFKFYASTYMCMYIFHLIMYVNRLYVYHIYPFIHRLYPSINLYNIAIRPYTIYFHISFLYIYLSSLYIYLSSLSIYL